MTNATRVQLKRTLRDRVAAGQLGLQLDTEFRWVVPGLKEPAPFFRNLPLLIPTGVILYFEGCSIARDVAAFYDHYASSAPEAVPCDTLFPVPERFHVTFSPEVASRLPELALTRPTKELFDHVKSYQGKAVLFHFHDAFDNDLLVSDHVSETNLARFCTNLGTTYRREPNVNQSQEGLRALLEAMEHPGRIRIAGEPWWSRWRRRLTWR